MSFFLSVSRYNLWVGCTRALLSTCTSILSLGCYRERRPVLGYFVTTPSYQLHGSPNSQGFTAEPESNYLGLYFVSNPLVPFAGGWDRFTDSRSWVFIGRLSSSPASSHKFRSWVPVAPTTASFGGQLGDSWEMPLGDSWGDSNERPSGGRR